MDESTGCARVKAQWANTEPEISVSFSRMILRKLCLFEKVLDYKNMAQEPVVLDANVPWSDL
jgi:hypothetical protein